MKTDTKLYLQRLYNKPLSSSSNFDELVLTALPFFEAANTPVSLGLYLRLKYKAYAEYLNFNIDPLCYNNPDVFRLDYQCAKLFQKYENFPRVYDARKEAERSFIKAEKSCLETNDRFSMREDPEFLDPALSNILYIAMRKISIILGDCPNLGSLDFRFGPGKVIGLSGDKTNLFDKLSCGLTLTSNLLSSADTIMASCPGWTTNIPGKVYTSLTDFTFNYVVTEGSKLGFVPKTAKTDRAICTEPLLNSFVQLGIGAHMRKKLRQSGCNLNSQFHNQELARVGSLTNDLATIDLSSASDTISYRIVLELLPAPWFDLLSSCRCPTYTYQGKTYHFEKFSSMGNGYTFELESLIFLALSRAVCQHLGISDGNVSVYGDDIIIPSKAEPLLRQVLAFVGFTVNESKSFVNGPFRESCGEDWFLGQPVRPLFLKRRVMPSSIMAWCNWIYRNSDGLLDWRYERLYNSLKSLVPSAFKKLLGPDGFGDGHFVCSRDDAFRIPSSKRGLGWDGFAYYTLTATPLTKSLTHPLIHSVALFLASNCGHDETSLDNALGLYPKLHLREPLHIDNLSVTQEGRYQYTWRDRTRTVVKQMFHP
jgi:hypothetical protein